MPLHMLRNHDAICAVSCKRGSQRCRLRKQSWTNRSRRCCPLLRLRCSVHASKLTPFPPQLLRHTWRNNLSALTQNETSAEMKRHCDGVLFSHARHHFEAAAAAAVAGLGRRPLKPIPSHVIVTVPRSVCVQLNVAPVKRPAANTSRHTINTLTAHKSECSHRTDVDACFAMPVCET